jgi:CRP-like cAMP-binding protein
VRSGFFKTDVLIEDGRDQVTGFQMTGELLGLDGISSEIHTCNAIALEDSEVCAIPFSHLEGLSRQIHTLQHHFHKVMSREIVRDHGVMMLLGTMRAEERLAAFLLNLSQRFKARGYSPAEFNLRMSRDEIGSYLGLKLETVSRAFSHFQEEGLLAVHQRKGPDSQQGRLEKADDSPARLTGWQSRRVASGQPGDEAEGLRVKATRQRCRQMQSARRPGRPLAAPCCARV